MRKQEKVLHGSCSEAFINGKREPLLTKIEVKVTGDFEDGTFCGDYGTYPIYNGYSVEGTLTGKKSDSTLEVAIAEGYRTGMGDDYNKIGPLKLFVDGSLGHCPQGAGIAGCRRGIRTMVDSRHHDIRLPVGKDAVDPEFHAA